MERKVSKSKTIKAKRTARVEWGKEVVGHVLVAGWAGIVKAHRVFLRMLRIVDSNHLSMLPFRFWQHQRVNPIPNNIARCLIVSHFKCKNNGRLDHNW